MFYTTIVEIESNEIRSIYKHYYLKTLSKTPRMTVYQWFFSFFVTSRVRD